MEPRKYSTGTKGRLKMHCDMCKEFIRANSPTFSLAQEFIESIDPDREERAWQRFQCPEDILPDLLAWLGGGEKSPAAPAPQPARPAIQPASQLARSTNHKADAALQKTREWLASPGGATELTSLTPDRAAESALRKFYRELTGAEAPNR